MRSVAFFLLAATALIVTPSRPSQHPEHSRSSETIWFSLQANPPRGFFIEPIARVSEWKLLPIPNGCRDKDPAYEEFRKTYATTGRSYNVLFRGRPAGRASLLEADGTFAPFAVKYGGSAPLDEQTEALATDATGHLSAVSSRLSPTTAERRASVSIAKELFVQAGVAPKLLAGLKMESLTRTILPPSKHPSLIGSFSIPFDNGESGIVHNLFFITTAMGNGYTTEFSWIKISRGETDNEEMQFIDQADLFGDGRDEVIVGLGLYENHFYCIYERKKGSSRWEQIFSVESAGCD